MKNIFKILPLLFFIGACSSIGAVGSTHEHSTFKVYLSDSMLDFKQAKYMVRSQHVHIEGGDGDTIHKHATGITLGYFFNTLGYKFDNNCFVTDNTESYCNDGDKTLKFYVNGIINTEYNNHIIKDGDKYLISYGNDSEIDIQKQIASIKEITVSAMGAKE